MKIGRGSITLKKITQEDLELIRHWRNADQVKKYMVYREQISEDMQQDWFATINNPGNLYFLIIANDLPIGLIYGADFNWIQKEVGNAGIFIAEENNRENKYALQASILLNDYAFDLGIETIYIKVRHDNPRAIAYNKLMGYERIERDGEVDRFKLTKSAYFIARMKFDLFT